MKIVLGLLLACLTSNSALSQPSAPSVESGNYSEMCKEEWTKIGVLNKQMFNYCVKLQRDGNAKLAHLLQTYKDFDWLDAALRASIDQWSKSGSRNDSQIAYELNLEITEYRDMQFRKTHAGFDGSKYIKCENQFKPKYQLVAYCYKNM